MSDAYKIALITSHLSAGYQKRGLTVPSPDALVRQAEAIEPSFGTDTHNRLVALTDQSLEATIDGLIGSAEKANELTPDDERKQYGGYLKRDFDQLSQWRQSAILDEIKGPAEASWKQSVPKAAPLPADVLARMSPEEKIAYGNKPLGEAKGYR